MRIATLLARRSTREAWAEQLTWQPGDYAEGETPAAPAEDLRRRPTWRSRGPYRPCFLHQGRLAWPIWTAPLRLADLEATLCCGWSWPTMEARRWLSGKLYCFSRGELREPKASRESAEVRAA